MQGIAAFPKTSVPAFADLPEPESPKSGEVLCRTVQLGLCGTDREILESEQPNVPLGEDFLVLGHECMARVEAVGDGVTNFAVGDLVIPTVRRSVAGSPHRIDFQSFHEYTERGIVRQHGFSSPLWLEDPQYLLSVPKTIADFGVFVEPLAVAEKGINEAIILQQARLTAETWVKSPPRVLVTGLGPIAFAGVMASVARNWPTTVYGRDPRDTFRAQLVTEFGATYLPDTETNFEPEHIDEEGYDLILECTGSDTLTVKISNLLAPRGVMVWLGAPRSPKPSTTNFASMLRRGMLQNHLHVGSVNSAHRDFEDAIAHLGQLFESHRQPVEKIVTKRVTPKESLWDYENREKQGIKVVLMYE